MCRLREAIRQKCTELWKSQQWNACAKNKIVIMPQPLYSPDLAADDFFLFPKLNTPMKGKRFATIEEIKKNRNRGTVGDTKKRFSEVFRGMEKTLT